MPIPNPIKHPIAPVVHTVAAVVNPLIVSPSLNIRPAPRNPIPETIRLIINIVNNVPL